MVVGQVNLAESPGKFQFLRAEAVAARIPFAVVGCKQLHHAKGLGVLEAAGKAMRLAGLTKHAHVELGIALLLGQRLIMVLA